MSKPMLVEDLIAALRELPQKAEVYIPEDPTEWSVYGSEREPDPRFDADSSRTYSAGVLAYPNGRVKL